MSGDGLGAVQVALIGYLRGQAALEPLLGSPVRIYDEPPLGAGYPHVRLGRAQSRAAGTTGGGDLCEHALGLTVVSRFGGTEEVRAIVAEVRCLIDEAVLDLGAFRLVSLWVSFVDVFLSTDERTVYGVMRLRAVTEEMGG